MIKRITLFKIILLVNINIAFSGGVFSNFDKFSVYGSASFNSYKESFVSESLELVNIRPNLSGFTLGAIYASRYEISFSYLNNSESINIYNFPFSGKYILTKFYFHTHRFEKINFKAGFSSMNSNDSDYLRNSILFSIYEEINYFNNPVVMYLDLAKSSQDYTGCENKSFTGFSIGGDVKLPVDKMDNEELKDIIWFGFSINTNDFNKYYFGLSTGLFIPLK